jgi:hypothetical protein
MAALSAPSFLCLNWLVWRRSLAPKGEKITSPQDLRPVLEKHLSSDDLTVLDIAVAE